MNIQRATLLLIWPILCMDVCLSQNDCTGVDCPTLQNCLETVLEMGACCPTCTLRGCTCEGYQYYDCVQAGFRKGKVPEGESYFVDFGSTECSCPHGGGKISCRFIPCPEITPNCIEVLQPADGCPQCGRVGCTHDSKMYEAGHSVQIDQCQVCYCPNAGGRLMCSPIPDCDLSSGNKPMWATTENNNPMRDTGSSHNSPVEPFSTLGNTLPLYKQDPPSFGTEDYDHTLAEPTSFTMQHLAKPLESTTVPIKSSSISFNSHHDRNDGPNPVSNREDDNTDPTNVGAQSETAWLTSTTTENHRSQEDFGKRSIDQSSDRIRVVQNALKDTAYTAHANKVGSHLGRHKQSQASHTESSARHKGQEKASTEHRWVSKEEQSTIRFRPTSMTPIKISEHGDQSQRQPQTLYNHRSEDMAADIEGWFACIKY